MNRSKVLTTCLGLLVALTGAFGLAACGGGDEPSPAASSQSAQTDVDVAQDLQTARQAVLDALADDPDWTQVMLAGDVKAPTQKYGLLVMPFVASDAASHVTGTVNVDGGKFVVEATSAATGKTWQIDQDGAVTEVTK